MRPAWDAFETLSQRRIGKKEWKGFRGGEEGEKGKQREEVTSISG